MYEQLHLRVKEKKTEVYLVRGRKFLGNCLRRCAGKYIPGYPTQALAYGNDDIRDLTMRQARGTGGGTAKPGGVQGAAPYVDEYLKHHRISPF